MIELDRVRADVLAMFPTVVTQVGADLQPAREAILEHSRARLQEGRYFVVVCGEFRRGKSSLLNALVERTALFPVDVDVTTSVVITLQWGETEQAVVYFAPTDDQAPDSAPPPEVVELSEVVRYATEQANPGNDRNVLRVEMSARIDQLRTGMVLVDTPGVGSENASHSAATRAFLPSADAILFVGSAVQPLGTVELDFLAHAVAQCPIVVTAITMMDKVIDPAPVLVEARDRIAKIAEVEPESLVVVAVSSLRKTTALATEDFDLVEDSGFPELETELWEGLAATCGAVQLGAALDALDAAVADGEAPLSNELAALANDSELARIDGELREAQAKAAELRATGSRWRDRLRDEIEHGSRAIQDRLADDFETVREDFKQATKTDTALSNPDAVIKATSEEMVDAANRASSALAALVDDVAERYSKETSVALTASGVRSAGAGDLRIGEVSLDEATPVHGFTKFRHVWGGGLAGGGLGATVGGIVGSFVPVVGTFVGAVVGGVIGQIAGWFGGRKQSRINELDRQQREHRRSLREQVLPKIESARRKAEKDLARQIRDTTKALVTALEGQLTAAAESLGESTERLQEARRSTAADRAARHEALQAEQQKFVALRTSLDELRGRVQELARRGPA